MSDNLRPTDRQNKPAGGGDRRGEGALRPAFGSNAQAFCFLVLVVFALTVPAIITKSGWVSRRDSYKLMSDNLGAYSFVESEIFDHKEDIDIVFLGSSVTWRAVDAPQVQLALADKLRRPARAVTFGSTFNSVDILYTQLKDVLQRKRAGMVILSLPRRIPYPDGPSPPAYKFIRYNDNEEVFEGLPLRYRITLYASGVLRSPHDLLTLLRQNRTAPSPYQANLGSFKGALGWDGADKFEEFKPAAPGLSAADLIYSPEEQDGLEFTDEEITPYQNHHLVKLVELLKREQIPLVILNIPIYSERHSPRVVERKDWRKTLGADVPIIGVAPKVLFAGLSDEQVKKLYYDVDHMNINGSEFFTRTILPAVLEVYSSHAAKK